MNRPNFRPPFLDDLQARISDLARSGPAAHFEQNLKALMGSAFSKMELVTREEFDTQVQMLARMRERLNQLETRVAQLEARDAATTSDDQQA